MSTSEQEVVQKPRQVIYGVTKVQQDSSSLKWKDRKDLHTMIKYANFSMSEIWPIKYGPGIIGLGAALGGYVFNRHFRESLYLMHYARFASYLPVVALPYLFTVIAHNELVTNKIIHEETPSCSTCLLARASAINIGLGVVYPVIMTQVVSFHTLTAMKNSYTVPNLVKNPRGVLEVSKGIMKTMKIQFFALLALNFALPSVITFFEQYNYTSIIYPRLVSNMNKSNAAQEPVIEKE